MGDQGIKVSVFMLTYNHEKYIRQAIESVLMQKVNFQYEIVIGDDASTDNTRQIVQEYAKKYPDIIRAYCRKNNVGAMNNSLSIHRKCRGTYLAYLEGDDFWNDENKLQTQVDFLEQNDEYSACFTDADVIRDSAYLIPYVRRDIDGLKDYLNKGNNLLDIPTATLVCRNYYVTEKELYKYYKGLQIVGDRVTHTILLTHGKMKYIPIKSATYRHITKGNNSFSSIKTRNRYDDTIRCFKNCIVLSGGKYFHLWMLNLAKVYEQLFLWIKKYQGKSELIKEYLNKMDILEKLYTFRYFKNNIIKNSEG